MLLTFTVKPTIAQAWEWLDKAIRFEAQGRDQAVNLALKRACELELAALDFVQYRITAA